MLLDRLGVPFDVVVPDVDEAVRPGELPAAYVGRVASDKARSVDGAGALVLAADTAVVVGGDILGKPESAAEAVSMLARLQARSHAVMTGLAVALDGGEPSVHVETTTVTMAPMSTMEIAAYVAGGEPFDKAGAYAIQELGGAFVERIEGDPWNVVGLPLRAVYRMLRDAGALGG
jgi:septum formation protein